ncbi:ABC transporter permease [Pseudotabrizicola alkalilacus]|uniref:ABC transporter permease n=1 Tax=Pseudotabrizicola alkalilacus TaxID=2305252 RepID=A0A411YYS6_9RHOB|nr:ABC transporter permease [Pseudotabrizicola alkalilacus]RGP35913.1 ABC transporter permease [Pseudotabrizicola alkalilacus]
MIIAILRILARRLLAIIPVFVVVTILVFGALRILPVDPAQMSLPPSATIEQVEAKREAMGLNRPIWEQYTIWAKGAVAGDLGESSQYRMSTAAVVLDRLPATIELVICALVFAVGVGVGGGLLVFSARDTVLETVGLVVISAVMALPDFLLALLFILVLGVLMPIFPVNGRLEPGMQVPTQTGFLLIDALLTGDFRAFFSALHYIALPVMALGLAFSPTIMRVLHASLVNTYQQSYILQARLRGLSGREILFGQALKNAMLPVVILVGTQFGGLFGGTLLVEMIFSFPGLGNLMVKAMQTSDLSVIMAISLIYCATTLLFNSLADALAYLLNPRLRNG